MMEEPARPSRSAWWRRLFHRPGGAGADVERLRTAYVDLLVRAVANTIYEDPAIDPWSGGCYDAAKREDGRDWPQVAHSMIGLKRLQNVRVAAETVVREH